MTTTQIGADRRDGDHLPRDRARDRLLKPLIEGRRYDLVLDTDRSPVADAVQMGSSQRRRGGHSKRHLPTHAERE
jgi:hypothetical protein